MNTSRPSRTKSKTPRSRGPQFMRGAASGCLMASLILAASGISRADFPFLGPKNAAAPPSPGFILSQEPPRFEHPPLLYREPDYQSNAFSGAYLAPDDGLSASGRAVDRFAAPTNFEGEPLLPPGFENASYLEASFSNGPNDFGGPFLNDQMADFDCVAIEDHKNGFFQKLSLTTSWIGGPGDNDFGITEIELFSRFAVPAPTRKWPLLITPGLNISYLDGPTATDLPPALYDAYLQFMWVPRISERWTAILDVTPTVYSDFENPDADAFRLTGKGLARFDWKPGYLQLLFGVLYLNRDDIRLLPAGGLIWTPNDDIRYEMIFPRPKLAHRIVAACDHEDWVYLAGEFGGDTWSIERAGGGQDKTTLRDLRVMIGLERKRDGGAGRRLEIGYVFGRRIEYASGSPEYEPDDAVMIRGGLTY